MTLIFVVIGIYLLVTFVTGFIGFKKSGSSPDDYFLAGRGVGTVVMFFTLIATNFSAFFFLGFAGIGAADACGNCERVNLESCKRAMHDWRCGRREREPLMPAA